MGVGVRKVQDKGGGNTAALRPRGGAKIERIKKYLILWRTLVSGIGAYSHACAAASRLQGGVESAAAVQEQSSAGRIYSRGRGGRSSCRSSSLPAA